jgi:hypothetical protein
MLPAELRLRVAITEDDIYHNGGNGQLYHHQAFRYMYPTTSGLPMYSGPGTHQYTVDCALNAGWVYNNLRATVYIQDEQTYEIIQAATNFLSNIETSLTSVSSPEAQPARLVGNYPNPFNPATKIAFELHRGQQVKLDVYSLEGRHVATLINEPKSAGRHEVIWHGVDSNGKEVASGTYFCRLKAGDAVETVRMSLIR